MTTDTEAFKALTSLEAKLTTKRVTRDTDQGAICKQYKSIKPLLQAALPLIEKIPLYGSKIATAIRFLMTIADVACPVA